MLQANVPMHNEAGQTSKTVSQSMLHDSCGLIGFSMNCKGPAESHLRQVKRVASKIRTSWSLLATSMLAAPDWPMKTSMPFVMLLSLVLTRTLQHRHAKQVRK